MLSYMIIIKIICKSLQTYDMINIVCNKSCWKYFSTRYREYNCKSTDFEKIEFCQYVIREGEMYVCTGNSQIYQL